MEIKGIFSGIPEKIQGEWFEELLRTKSLKIERIVSDAHSSPEGFWYDQEQNEWVLLLQGKAGLLFEDSNQPLVLKAGDWINIPAHKKHRVEWTSSEEKTIWLAIFY
ncbi:MAG: cupin domain-containing protein [Syntrophobacteraceae bacterium]